MPELVQSLPFQIYALSCVVLTINVMFLALFASTRRIKQSQSLNPEDQPLTKAKNLVQQDEGETLRLKRVHQNALENIPFFMITGLIYVLFNPGATEAIVLFGVFTFARLIHSFAYIKAIQPLRSLVFTVAFLVQGIILLRIAWASISALMS